VRTRTGLFKNGQSAVSCSLVTSGKAQLGIGIGGDVSGLGVERHMQPELTDSYSDGSNH